MVKEFGLQELWNGTTAKSQCLRILACVKGHGNIGDEMMFSALAEPFI